MSEKIESNLENFKENFKAFGYEYVGTLHVEKGIVKLENDIPFDTFQAAMHYIFPDGISSRMTLKNHNFMWSGKVITTTALYINKKAVEHVKPSVWPTFPWMNPNLKKDWEECAGNYEFRLFAKT
jgi:hypothetical protein